MKKKLPPLALYSDEEIFSEAARRMRARQDTPNPKVLRPCPFCKKPFGARALRKHKPRCPKK